MSKPYDATPKSLIRMGPADWAAFLGWNVDSVEVMDADVSTVTAAADKVLRVRAQQGEFIQHIDCQAGPDAGLPSRLHLYDALLGHRHTLPVETVLILLRPEANLRVLDGKYRQFLPGVKEPHLDFRYRIIRLWEVPVDSLLDGGPSLLPLAPISAVTPAQVPGVIGRIRDRLHRETDGATAAELWTATRILMGLRYEEPFIQTVLQGVREMKESVSYQAIVEEGRVEEAQRLLLQQGEHRFRRPPSPAQRTALEGTVDVAELERLGLRLLDVADWDELLAVPAPAPRGRRKKT